MNDQSLDVESETFATARVMNIPFRSRQLQRARQAHTVWSVLQVLVLAVRSSRLRLFQATTDRALCANVAVLHELLAQSLGRVVGVGLRSPTSLPRGYKYLR